MTRKFLIATFGLIVCIVAIYFYLHKSSNKTNIRLNKPNILLITIDTIRPDYVSCYGGSNSTPHIDSIAKNGILFENAFSEIPLTFPSHTSILSGLSPAHHGIHNNGMEVLSKNELLISHELKKHGYRTGAVVSSFVLDRKFGLQKDFDVYEDHMERSPGLTSNFEVERTGNEVTENAKQILTNFGSSPWFLWLHYYDPHTPYAPPKPFEGYEGEIQFVDSQIGKLFDWMKAENKTQNLVIAIIGDHGESLGEHGEATHGFFTYNSTLRVPFLLSYPGSSQKRIAEATSTVDVIPTFIQLMGIQDPVQRDGESVLPIIEGGKRTKDIYFESKYPELLGWNGLQGIIRQEWKLIATTRSELYNWHDDPKEERNLFSKQQNISIKLKNEVVNYYANSTNEQKTAPDSETLEKLKSLGYIGTTNTLVKKTGGDPKDKIEVWSKYEALLQLQQEGKKEEALKKLEELAAAEPENNFFRITLATRYREAGDSESALTELKKAIQNDPSDANAYQELALTYKEIRNYSEAIKAQQASLALDPERSDAQGLMGILLVETGRFQEASNFFSKVLRQDPNNAVAWNNYGNALRELNRLEEAKKAYEESIRLSPHYAFPLNGIATILVRQNKTADAIPYFEKAIKLDPEFVEVYLNLGIAYHTLGETAKARTLYKTFLKISPEWMKQERENAQMLLSQLG